MVIFGLKPKMAIFFVKTFYSGGILDQSDYNFSIPCNRRFFNQNMIPIQNAGVDHTFSLDFQEEYLVLRELFCRKREKAFNVFLGEKRLAGSYFADNGYACHFFVENPVFVIHDFNRTGLRRVSPDKTILFKSLQM